MSKHRSLIRLTGLSALAGAIGFSGGYAANNRTANEFILPLGQVVRVEMAELAYGFARADQVRAMIEKEPPQQGEWAHTENRVKVLRKLRLAVVAESNVQRDALLEEAQALCEDCRPTSLRKMLERYAQERLVPPGNDIPCENCGTKRRTLPPVK